MPSVISGLFTNISSKLENPIGSNLAKQEEQTEQTAKQGSDTQQQTNIIPAAQPATDNTPVKQSLSMLSDSVDWGQIAAY